MKQVLFVPFLLISLIGLSQESTSDFCSHYYDIFQPFWESQGIETQIRHWPNGNLRTSYESSSDSIRTRFEYYESGNLKYTAQVYQIYRADTMFIEDPDTGEFTRTVKSGYSDVAHGVYKEYADVTGGSQLAQGVFESSIITGEWWVLNANQELVVANFNNSGKLDGEYAIYFGNDPDDRGRLKLKGQYGVFDYQHARVDSDTGEKVEYPRTRSHRTGTWTEYDAGGDTLQVIEYTWKRR